MTFCHPTRSWHAGGVLELIDGFILHLATERGLSVNYQILVRRFLEAFASWFKKVHDPNRPPGDHGAHHGLFGSGRKTASPLLRRGSNWSPENLFPLAHGAGNTSRQTRRMRSCRRTGKTPA
jgi:hypothetical protein